MIRARWMTCFMDGWEVYDGTQRLPKWDLYVFQKAYLGQRTQDLIMRLVEYRERGGGLLAFDLCDPDFLNDADNGPRDRMLQVLPYFDFATAPTQPLASWLGQWVPSYVIPDGVNPDAITVHHPFSDACPPKTCWFGYKGNSGALRSMLHVISDLRVDVDVIEVNTPVSFDQFLATLTQYDVMLNPHPPIPPYLYKSNNKTLIALAAGVAVAETEAELRQVVTVEGRRAQLDAFDLDAHHIRRSAEMFVEAWERERAYAAA